MLDALRSWREHVGRALLNIDFRPHGDAPFRAAIRPLLMTDSVRVVAHTHSPGFTYRDADMVRDGLHWQSVVMPVSRPLYFSHCGRSDRLRPGEATLLSHCDPGEVGATHDVSFIAIVMPGVRASTGQLIGRRWTTASSGCLRLLRGYIALLARESSTSEAATAAAAQHIAGLLEGAAEECLSATPLTEETGSIQDVRCATARAFIAANFHDPGLSLASVAASQGISTRYLQRLLEQAGLRYASLLSDLRLDEVARALADPMRCCASILEIALAAGFSDVSHFNRQFKRRFGVTPSALRQQLARERAGLH